MIKFRGNTENSMGARWWVNQKRQEITAEINQGVMIKTIPQSKEGLKRQIERNSSLIKQ